MAKVAENPVSKKTEAIKLKNKSMDLTAIVIKPILGVRRKQIAQIGNMIRSETKAFTFTRFKKYIDIDGVSCFIRKMLLRSNPME
jgi:hypothetical protein